jgi:hypothetical protein
MCEMGGPSALSKQKYICDKLWWGNNCLSCVCVWYLHICWMKKRDRRKKKERKRRAGMSVS